MHVQKLRFCYFFNYVVKSIGFKALEWSMVATLIGVAALLFL
jgi:hypothetical protein